MASSALPTTGHNKTNKVLSMTQKHKISKLTNKCKFGPKVTTAFLCPNQQALIDSHRQPSKNLGVILDADNSMQRHVANLCRTCYCHIWKLRRVRRYLNHETAVKLANALVSSCLNYCNSLLYHTKRHILSDNKEFKMP